MNNRSIFLTLCLCVSVVILSCSNKSKLQPDTARKIIAQELKVPEKRVQVWNASQLGGTVLAEGALRVTFVLQQDKNKQWHFLKIKFSDEWESPEKFFQSFPQSSLSSSLRSAFLAELK